MKLPIKPHTRTLEQQWATPSSTEYKDGGQEPEVVMARYQDNYM